MSDPILDPSYVQAVEKRHGRATPGPWCYAYEKDSPQRDIRVCQVRSEEQICQLALTHNPTKETVGQWMDDASFIAYARFDVPFLLAAVRKLQKRIAELESLRNAENGHRGRRGFLRSGTMAKSELEKLRAWVGRVLRQSDARCGYFGSCRNAYNDGLRDCRKQINKMLKRKERG